MWDEKVWNYQNLYGYLLWNARIQQCHKSLWWQVQSDAGRRLRLASLYSTYLVLYAGFATITQSCQSDLLDTRGREWTAFLEQIWRLQFGSLPFGLAGPLVVEAEARRSGLRSGLEHGFVQIRFASDAELLVDGFSSYCPWMIENSVDECARLTALFAEFSLSYG